LINYKIITCLSKHFWINSWWKRLQVKPNCSKYVTLDKGMFKLQHLENLKKFFSLICLNMFSFWNKVCKIQQLNYSFYLPWEKKKKKRKEIWIENKIYIKHHKSFFYNWQPIGVPYGKKAYRTWHQFKSNLRSIKPKSTHLLFQWRFWHRIVILPCQRDELIILKNGINTPMQMKKFRSKQCRVDISTILSD